MSVVTMAEVPTVSSSSSSSSSRLEPLLVLAKSTKPRGAAAAHLIQQATSAPGIYFFAQLFQVPGIADLASSDDPTLRLSYQLLQIFAYGTWSDYQSLATPPPTLSTEQHFKLRQLTLLSLASQTKVLTYPDLFRALEIEPSHLRQLEDLIIETVYAGLLSGKLNQLHSRFEVHHVQGRDIPPLTQSSAQIDHLHATLTDWQLTTQNVLSALETRMQHIKATAATAQSQRQDHNSLLLQNLALAHEQVDRQQKQQQQQQKQQKFHPAKGKNASSLAMDLDDVDTYRSATSGRNKGAVSGGVRGSKRSRA